MPESVLNESEILKKKKSEMHPTTKVNSESTSSDYIKPPSESGRFK